MLRRIAWLLVLILLSLLGWLFWPTQDAVVEPQKPVPRIEPPSALPVGNQILQPYGAAESTPEDDLTWMHRALGNFATLVKGDNPIPLGANEEIAAALMGKNKVKLEFLRPPSQALNAAHQLVDRWGSPLYFHAVARDRLDIRSAGPDRVLWTQDDIHRKADGRFLRGDELTAPSLFEKP